jgi:acyl-CoA synthetase (AMP-forming)/AMP-acid ligase II
VTSMFAAWRLGAAVTPVNPALTAQQARYQIDDAAATLVVADDGSAVKLQDIGRPTPDDLIERCRAALARYKVPRGGVHRGVAAEDRIGKIAEPVLRERLRSQQSSVLSR